MEVKFEDGIRITSYNDKPKRYTAFITVNKVKISKSFKSKREAIAWRKKVKESGEYGDKKYTVNQLFDFYMAKLKSTKTNTHMAYKNLYKNHLKPYIGTKRFSDLNQHKLEIILGKILHEKKLMPSTYNAILKMLKTLANYAEKNQFIDRNPTRFIRKMAIDRSNYNYWNEVQMNNFLTRIKDNHYYSLFFFAFNTGLRRGEILALTWHDISFNHDKKIGYMKISKQRNQNGTVSLETKSKSAKLIPFNSKIYDLLQTIPKNEYGWDEIFLNKKGKAINPTNISQEFKKLQKELNIKNALKFHDIRHSYATMLTHNGVSINIVQKLLGHSSINITERYSHVEVSDLENAIINT